MGSTSIFTRASITWTPLCTNTRHAHRDTLLFGGCGDPDRLRCMLHHNLVVCACQVLVNASLSDVVATTSAEALAMGKWILVARCRLCWRDLCVCRKCFLA